ncbi:phage head closure protein [Salmonella enterica subsp. enterica serovar Infantis]
MAISAGRLIQVIVIQNPVHIRDNSGQPVEIWEDGETIRADIRGRSGRELMAAGAEIAQADVRVWVRGKSGEKITAASRLKVQKLRRYRGKTLNVIAPPIPDEKGERLEILCKLGAEK